MKVPISMPLGGRAKISSADVRAGCSAALRKQFTAAEDPWCGDRDAYAFYACTTSGASRTTFRTRRKFDALPDVVLGGCVTQQHWLLSTALRRQVAGCVSRQMAVTHASTWRAPRGRAPASAKAPSDAMSPERGSKCQVRATSLSPIQLLLPPAAAAQLASDATEAAVEVLQARQEAAKRSRTLAERRAHSRRCLWAKRMQTAAAQLQQAWRCRMARGERTRRAEAQAALARRKEAARERLARREAEVREEREQRQRERAAKAEAATEVVQVEEAKTAQVEEAAAEESMVAESDEIEFEWSSVKWSDVEWNTPTAEAAVQTETVLRRLHITDVAETGCQAECTRQEAGCQTDACQAALAGLAVVSGGLAESVAISGGVTPKRSGGKQRKAWR